MAKNTRILTNIAFKKLANATITNPGNSEFQEAIKTNVQIGANTIFANTPPASGLPATLYDTSSGGYVQYVELDLVAIGSSNYDADTYSEDSSDYDNVDSNQGVVDHAYAAKLPSDYETQDGSNTDFTSQNPKAGTGYFINGGFLSGSGGSVQIVPPSFGLGYIPVIEDNNGGNPSLGGDAQDFYIDYYSGVVFRQDDDPNSYYPVKLKCYIYISDFVTDALQNTGDTVDLHISASEGSGFSFANNATASFTSGSGGGLTVTAGPTNNIEFELVNVISGSEQITDLGLGIHMSSSEGDGFSVIIGETASFESSSAGISVTAGATNTITIGAATDNVIFNNITATGDIIAQNYIVSSSITYMTQSFSSGSTIFGDTNDDTHQFTGSISILHTGSGYGFELSGSSINIDAGSSGSLTLGNHNVGIDIVSNFPITGSGLIISQSNLPNFHYNMVKIGNVELLDYTGISGDGFLIDTKDRAFIISSSDASKPIANLKSGNTDLYNGDGNVALKISTANTTLGVTSGTGIPTTTVQGSTTLLGGSNVTHIRAHGGTPGNNTDATNTSHVLFSLGQPDASFNSSNNKIESTPLNTLFTYLGGAVTASAVSSSGLLFASLSGDPTHNDGILTVVYDTGSGQFYFTGSYGVSDTTDLEASASQGIYFWTGSGAGSSIGLMQTASFTSNGAGLGVDFNEGNNTFTYTLTPQNVFDAFDTANTGSFTASYANTASFATTASYAVSASYAISASHAISASYAISSSYANTASFTITASHALTASTVQVTNSSNNQNYGVVFADNTGSANLLSDQAYGLTFNPSSHALIVSGTDPSIIIDTGDFPDYHKIRVNQIDYTGSTYQLINSQGPTDNTDTTINFGIKTHTINMGAANGTVNINGSASIEGDLIVKGAVTSVETDNLNVQDQFILLNSGSGPTTLDGGIIIRQTDDAEGAALFLDSNVSRFAVAKSIPWDQTTDITTDTNSTMEYIVTVTSSVGAPPTVEWGTGDFTSYGNMYVDTDTGDIYIYGG